MKRAFLDTNILARFLIGDVENQQAKVEEIFKFGTNLDYEYVILPEILLELNYVMSKHYKFEKGKIVESIEDLLDLHFMILQQNYVLDFKNVLDKYSKFNISLEDCLYLEYCKENNLELITFDKKLLNVWSSQN